MDLVGENNLTFKGETGTAIELQWSLGTVTIIETKGHVRLDTALPAELVIQHEEPRTESVIQHEEPRTESVIQHEEHRTESVIQHEEPRTESVIQHEVPRTESETQHEELTEVKPAMEPSMVFCILLTLLFIAYLSRKTKLFS
jgi:hypothetical protein